MGKEQIIKVVKKAGGIKFLTKLRVGGFLILFMIISLKAIISSIQQRTPKPFIEEVGGRVFYVTQQLNIESQLIIQKGSILSSSSGFFSDLWYLLSTYFTLWFTLISIYLWIKLFYKISTKLPGGNKAEWFPTMFWTLFLFFASQIIFLLVFQPENMAKTDALSIPFQSFGNFFRALPIIIAPLVGLADTMVPKENFNQSINATI